MMESDYFSLLKRDKPEWLDFMRLNSFLKCSSVAIHFNGMSKCLLSCVFKSHVFHSQKLEHRKHPHPCSEQRRRRLWFGPGDGLDLVRWTDFSLVRYRSWSRSSTSWTWARGPETLRFRTGTWNDHFHMKIKNDTNKILMLHGSVMCKKSKESPEHYAAFTGIQNTYFLISKGWKIWKKQQIN